VVGNDHLTRVRLGDGRIMPLAAVFVPPRFVPNNDLLVGGCDLDEQGWVVSGANGATTVPGVWVAGNAVDARAQLVTAAGEGSAAAIAMNADLIDNDVSDAIAVSSRRPALTINRQPQGFPTHADTQ
jgi:thioredoxin reductase